MKWYTKYNNHTKKNRSGQINEEPRFRVFHKYVVREIIIILLWPQICIHLLPVRCIHPVEIFFKWISHVLRCPRYIIILGHSEASWSISSCLCGSRSGVRFGYPCSYAIFLPYFAAPISRSNICQANILKQNNKKIKKQNRPNFK